MDWLDLLAVQGTLKSLLQHHSLKASILQRSAFFTVQLSHPYMTTGKTIALTRRTFVGKVMSLVLNMLSRLVITFLPRSKCTPRLRSGVVAGRSYPTPLSPRPGVACGRSYPTPPRPRPRVVARRSNPMPEARGSSWEDQPHVQEALAARAQEGLEELSHVEGQEGWQ